MSAEAREAQIRALFGLVKKIARRVSRMVPGSDVEDLVGEGCVGLVRAVDSFDPSRGPTLEQYASRIVAGAMLNGIRRLDPVSERVRRSIRDADRERYALATELGCMPTTAEMEARRPGLRRATTHAYRHAPVSLDAPLPNGERLSGDWDADPAAIIATSSERATIRASIAALSPRHQELLDLHYFRGQTLHAISRRMGVSPQRVSQLHLAALSQMRRVIDRANAAP
ncbi:MAG: sigma-70 family RNA polymerase sigma factor [Candidatus Eremiobacteraeota bacterium]|nr:sigma-70 family RNA polymerase sigma factor [Candidatus Eremiobacteraeota bacterium]MBV9971841.1 sigma-70 family RNA polymerase sigma factor [Candidatus Eremiobacteraeota bacterium]